MNQWSFVFFGTDIKFKQNTINMLRLCSNGHTVLLFNTNAKIKQMQD